MANFTEICSKTCTMQRDSYLKDYSHCTFTFITYVHWLANMNFIWGIGIVSNSEFRKS